MAGDISPILYALFWSGVIACACWFVVQWLEVVRSFRRREDLAAHEPPEAEAGAGGAEPPLGGRRPV